MEPVKEPESTWQKHDTTPETGLCARPWCDDAALPGEEYCKECLFEVLAIESEIMGDAA